MLGAIAAAVKAWLDAVAARHPRRVAWIAPLGIAAVAVAIAWAFCVTVLRHTRPMTLPLDGSYSYLVHARQLARGQLAGADGLWSIVLAPLWAIGARGAAWVWLTFCLCAALYAATAIGVYRIVRAIAGGAAGLAAALVLLGVAAFASSALAGTEAAITGALLVAIAHDLLDAPPTGPPAIRLALYLTAATSTGRAPAILAIAILLVAAIQRLRRRDLRAAAWWLLPLVVPVIWYAARGVFPARGAETAGLGHLLRAVCWDATSPLVWPRIFTVLWLAGAVRVVTWARHARRGLAASVILVAPVAVMIDALLLGRWGADSGRWLAPAWPFVMIGVGCAFGHAGHRLQRIAAALGVAAFAWFAIPGLIGAARRAAQAATDLAVDQAAGEYIHRHQPDARLLAERAGVIDYVADIPVTILTTSEGPGVLFEQLERLDPRPAIFAIDPAGPAAAAIAELSGDSLFRASPYPPFAPRRGSAPSIELFAARWDHAGTGERPLDDHVGWAIVDRLDLADRDSEAAHGWSAALGVAAGDPPARWSMLGREVGSQGLILDGGRTIRGGERFTLAVDPSRPTRLVLRTGGARSIPGHDPAGQPVDHAASLHLLDAANRELAAATAPASDGRFAELTFLLPAGTSPTLHTAASSPYRAFHWFALQPE